MAEAGASDCAELDRSASDVWRAGEAHAQRRSDRQLLVHIRAIHRRHKGRYGALRVTAELCEPGFMVNRKRVARIMRDHDIQGRVNRRFRATTTDSTHRMPVAPIRLMRDFSSNTPNQAFVGDTTHLRTSRGWVYVALLVDIFIARRPARGRGVGHGRHQGAFIVHTGLGPRAGHPR